MHEDAFAPRFVLAELTDCFKERQALDIADRTPDLAKHKIDFIFANRDEVFDLVGHVRDYLDRFT